MNARIAKEARNLLPGVAGALLLIVVTYAIWPHETPGSCFVGLAIGSAIMAATSFGNEFQHRTMPLLLAQPVPRRVVWREKMLVLGLGLGVVFSRHCCSAWKRDKERPRSISPALAPWCSFRCAPFAVGRK